MTAFQRLLAVAVLALTTGAALPAASRTHRRSEVRDTASVQRHRSTYCFDCERTASGRIKRNSSVRQQFQRQHPCPSTGIRSGHCSGYVVDHILSLKHGGTDTVNNMQWQSIVEAKNKDRAE